MTISNNIYVYIHIYHQRFQRLQVIECLFLSKREEFFEIRLFRETYAVSIKKNPSPYSFLPATRSRSISREHRRYCERRIA